MSALRPKKTPIRAAVPGDAIPDASPAGNRQARALGVLLFLLVAALFLPAVTHTFITYDDPVYVTENAHVTGGLTWEDVKWAFQSTEASNWHPVTWLSHMADCELFGVQPWGHHLTNLLLHALNAVLLFAVLRRITGALWRSLFVAALFGVHPLHVESVAWVAERKDVLSTTFWMLTLWAYGRRAELSRRPGPGAWIYYGWALLFLAIGLMCKSMLVTVPCVLLLLDYWPLNRWKGASKRARWMLFAEKIPFFALSAAASAATLLAQGHGGTVGSAEDFPWRLRVANALIACCQYLGKCFFPAKLAIFYPYFAIQPPLKATLLAAALLVAVTAVSAAFLRRRPYLLVGWLWFVGTLVPVIGLVQVGGQSLADRYTYVPLIGVFIMVVWAASDLAVPIPHANRALGAIGGAVLLMLAALTSRQLGFWKDGLSLFRHAIAVTKDNWVAHANLYATLVHTSPSAADAELKETTRILSAFAETYDQKGIELQKTPGHLPEAIKDFRTAIRIIRILPGPHYNLGTVLAQTPGGLPEAIEEFRAATRLDPAFFNAHFNLAVALSQSPDRRPEAIEEFRAVVRLRPTFADGHFNLGRLLSGVTGNEGEAISEYQATVALQPDYYQAHYYLGLSLAAIPGRRNEALSEFKEALRIRPDLEQARQMIERLSGSSP